MGGGGRCAACATTGPESCTHPHPRRHPHPPTGAPSLKYSEAVNSRIRQENFFQLRCYALMISRGAPLTGARPCPPPAAAPSAAPRTGHRGR